MNLSMSRHFNLKQTPIPTLTLAILSAIWIILVPIKSIAINSDTSLIYFIKVTLVLFLFYVISCVLIFKVRNRLSRFGSLSDLVLAVLISSIFAQFMFSESHLVLNGNDIQDQLNMTSYLQDFIIYNFFLLSLLALRKWTQPSIRKKFLLGAAIWTGGLLISSIILFLIGTVQNDNNLLSEQEYSKFEYSNSGDTLFIVLDSFQGSYFEQIIDKYPSEVSFLNGFTMFPDTLAAYPTTRGSTTNFSTGSLNLNSQEVQAHIKAQNHLIDYFKGKNYSLDLLAPDFGYNFSEKDIKESREVVLPKTAIDIFRASINQLEVSLFKLVPNVLKPYIYNSGNWLISGRIQSFSDLLIDRDRRSIKDFQEVAKISQGEKKIYHFYHFEGAHLPIRRLGDYPESHLKTSQDPILDNSRIALYKLKVLVEKLKTINRYNSLQILVISDHGYGLSSLANPPGTADFEIKGAQAAADALLLWKPRNGVGKLDFSNEKISLSDVPCILTNGEFATGCIATKSKIWKSNDGDDIRRFFMYNWEHENWTSAFLPPLQEFSVNGDSRKIANWAKVDLVNDSRKIEDLDFVPSGSALEIGTESVSKYLILNGFSSPEGTHRWSMGSVCSIDFRVKPEISKEGLRLEIGISSYQDTQLGRKIIVFVNNKFLRTINLDTSGIPTLLDIPKNYLNGQEIKIRFETPGSISPEILGSSPDSRLLGRAFKTFKVIGN